MHLQLQILLDENKIYKILFRISKRIASDNSSTTVKISDYYNSTEL